jgi:aryl-alcohol dehydrogenase-like predicted oxidoreductase
LQVWVEAEEYISPAEVRAQVQGQLKALRTDYLDLCLLPALSDGAAFLVHAHPTPPHLSCHL